MFFTIDYGSPDDIDALAIEFEESGFNKPIKTPSPKKLADPDKMTRWCRDALNTIAALHMSKIMTEVTCFSRDKKTRKNDILKVFQSEDAVKHMVEALKKYPEHPDERQFNGFDELTVLHDEPWIANGYALADGEPWSVACMAQALERAMGYIEPPAKLQSGYFNSVKAVHGAIDSIAPEFLNKPLPSFSANPDSFEDLMGWVTQCIDVMSAWSKYGWMGTGKEDEFAARLVFRSLSDFKYFATSLMKYPNYFGNPCIVFLESFFAMDDYLAEQDGPFSNKLLGKAILRAIEDLEK